MEIGKQISCNLASLVSLCVVTVLLAVGICHRRQNSRYGNGQNQLL